jgi:spore coat polysaccharide biosynthesis predicted glycosyltransferase SpsG
VSGNVLIRCDGSPEIGLGHIVRCIALARELRDVHQRDVAFAMRAGPLGLAMAHEAGFRTIGPPQGGRFSYGPWLADAVKSTEAEILVLDVRDELTADEVRTVRGDTGVSVALIDDGSERRFAADDVFYPPVPQARSLEWPVFNGRVHLGWEWVLLRREFSAEPRRSTHEPAAVLVTMGGSDPAGITLKAVRALALVGRPLDGTVLLGRAYGHEAELSRLLLNYPHQLRVVRDGDVRERMLAADLAILSFGVTSYEAAACALPAVTLCLTDDHATSAEAFVQAGIATSVGRADRVDEAQLAEAIERMLTDNAALGAMGARARSLVDGGGAARIAGAITERRSR